MEFLKDAFVQTPKHLTKGLFLTSKPGSLVLT